MPFSMNFLPVSIKYLSRYFLRVAQFNEETFILNVMPPKMILAAKIHELSTSAQAKYIFSPYTLLFIYKFASKDEFIS